MKGSRPLERPQHPHPEGSQIGVREDAITVLAVSLILILLAITFLPHSHAHRTGS
jgi:hypothetical protein